MGACTGLYRFHDLVLDCAHTPLSVSALTDTLKRVCGDAPCIFILALADDKDAEEIAATLIRAKPSLILCTRCDIAGSSERSTPVATVMAAARRALTLACGCTTGTEASQHPKDRAAIQFARMAPGAADWHIPHPAAAVRPTIDYYCGAGWSAQPLCLIKEIGIASAKDVDSALASAFEHAVELDVTPDLPSDFKPGWDKDAVICVTGSNYAVRAAALWFAQLPAREESSKVRTYDGLCYTLPLRPKR